jgi:hypothetical protein
MKVQEDIGEEMLEFSDTFLQLSVINQNNNNEEDE